MFAILIGIKAAKTAKTVLITLDRGNCAVGVFDGLGASTVTGAANSIDNS
jgi:hypothetical protein